jgi:DNA modification methylase
MEEVSVVLELYPAFVASDGARIRSPPFGLQSGLVVTEPVIIGRATLYLGDCRDILPTLPKVDAVVTDPEEYRYEDGIIDCLGDLTCRQLVFWSGRAEFPLSFTATHIWNKNPSNRGAQYERIFERHGGNHQKVFTSYMVNSTVAASMVGDELNDHPSQKPIKLITSLCSDISQKGQTIIDPFMGSWNHWRSRRPAWP